MKVYAIEQWKIVWRVALVDECNMPTSNFDDGYRIVIYSILDCYLV